jgi:hypothetical protein
MTIKEGFANHEITNNNRFSEPTISKQQRNVEFDKSFGQWKPKIDTSLSAIKLELNTFFDHEAKNTSASKLRVLPIESMSDRPVVGSAVNGPRGHRADLFHRDHGFGGV